jgi:hypothetical protein
MAWQAAMRTSGLSKGGLLQRKCRYLFSVEMVRDSATFGSPASVSYCSGSSRSMTSTSPDISASTRVVASPT